MAYSGLFITFEGPDGSGKTTQIHRLADRLVQEQIPFLLTREPGGTEISDQIRSLILNPQYLSLTDKTEILLYAASRSQHVEEKIKPALEEGKIVLCDRFVDASIAYQGYGLRQPIDIIRTVNRFATGGLVPDRTYMIDISPEAGRSRMKKRGGPSAAGESHVSGGLDRIERRTIDYHRRVREGFLSIYRENRQRICLIDGEDGINRITDHIVQDFHHFFSRRYEKTN